MQSGSLAAIDRPKNTSSAFTRWGPRSSFSPWAADGVLLSEEGNSTHIPARPIKAVDATGAGDSFWAGFLVALLDGNPLKRCALFAREIVERKLTTVGPLPDNLDRQEIYGVLDAASQAHSEEDART